MDLLMPYASIDEAAQTVSEIIEARIVPTAIEFMERNCFDLAESFTKRKLVFRDAAAHLLISLDGNQQEGLEEERDRVGEICERNGAFDVLIANTRPAMERMWEGRKCLFEAASEVGGMFKALDVVVPRSLIPALVKKIREISERYRVKAISFGHAGDGNVHVLLFKGELTDEEWEMLIDKAERGLYLETIELGGRITAEHGIGLLRKSFLGLNLDPHQIEILKSLKRAFDPKNILNPGKIFDL
jgi:glycolate oxidase